MNDCGQLLTVENLRVSFQRTNETILAVEDSSFSVGQGETLGIVGESGSGKSVTCYAILGLLQKPPAKIEGGSAIFCSMDLLHCPEKTLRAIRGKRIGMVFQDPMTCLNPYMTIGEQIIEPLLVHQNLPRDQAKVQALKMLEEVGIENGESRFDQYPHEFSGGMRQRAMIAMSLIAEPELLIADEPTSALDAGVQDQILELIKSLQRKMGIGLIFISHDLDVVRAVADRVIVMQNGQIVEQGNVEQVFSAPLHPYTQNLINSIPGGVKPDRYRFDSDNATDLLQVRHIRISFSGFNAVDDVSLNLHRGEILGIVGASGSGKSSLSRGIVSLERLDTGEVILDDIHLHDLSKSDLRRTRKDMQMIFQDPFASLSPRMTVYQIIAEPLKIHRIANSAEKVAEQVIILMEEVGLSPKWMNQYPHEFSGGQRQRIAIARALAVQPKVIIADEPVSALDVTVQAKVLDLLLEITRRRQLSLIFISHDMKVVHYMADRVITMKDGKLIE